jgi:hypothetical protein
VGTDTKVAVFIIESVKLEDEKEGRKEEGRILGSILRLSEVPSQYWYIRTERELRAVLEEFDKSRMRYLHLSCHGNNEVLRLTLNCVPFTRFGELIRPHIDGRRLFLSACEATNSELAKCVIPHSGCNSVIGPSGTIGFDDAGIFWASFYHLVFKQNPDAMKREDIKAVLPKVCSTFNVKMRYFAKSDKAPYYKEQDF